MKQVKRENVFETNSSSSHALHIATGELTDTPFTKQVLRDGVVTLRPSEYGWEWERMYQPIAKLEYLITYLLTMANDGDISDTRDFNMLQEVVKEYTGCDIKLVVSGTGYYIDHQSSDTATAAFKDKDTLKQFIFGKDSYIQTGNDNDYVPEYISSDKGKIATYGHLIAEVPSPGRLVVLTKCAWSYSIKGKPLPAKSTRLTNLAASGVAVSAKYLVPKKKYSEDSWMRRYYTPSYKKQEILAELADMGMKHAADFSVTVDVTDTVEKEEMHLTCVVPVKSRAKA